jgi:hypothetical protein
LSKLAPILAAALLTSTSACFGNESTFFPPGLEPLEDNTATAPEADASGHLPETINFKSGERGDLYFTHGVAIIRAPITTIWTAMQDPDVVVDRRAVDEYTYDRDIESGYDVSFVVHDVVHSIITVSFDITWRQSVVEGSREAPELIAMRFQKTDGTTTIETLSASILVRPASEPGVTELAVVEHLVALAGDNETIESQIRDLHESVVARVNGRPLPSF